MSTELIFFLKGTVLWFVTSCISKRDKRFGGTHLLELHVEA
jgi:hypothetical protein